MAERLPKEPMVITPIERVGQYGGQWRTGLVGSGDTPWLDRTMGYESLVRWDAEWKQLVPDIARKFEVSPDGRTFTFALREGMKWSDGRPFTADDLVFWYEDVVSNAELTKSKPAWFTTAGKLGKIEKADQYTIRMVFEQPHGTLLKRLSMNGAGGNYLVPAHYAKQFHIKHNKDGVDKLVADQKLADWVALYQKMIGTTQGVGNARWYNQEMPTLFAWAINGAYGQGTRLTAKRNPYYWKVDTEGNQLPYLDEIVYDMVNEAEVLVLKALNGEIEMMDRHIATPANKPVFTDNKAKGNYDFFTTVPDSMNTFIVLFNFNHKDPAMREIIRNPKFRIGLSHAINRQEIIDVVYVGQGQPWQAAPKKESPYYHERLATQYLEYNVAKANQLLDEAGLPKGPNGIRLRPDGKPLQMTWEVVGNNQPWIDTVNLIKKDWAAVGVDINVKAEERTLRQQRVTAYEHDVTNWGGDGGIDAILGPYWYLAYASFNSFATGWALWYETRGTGGEEPTPPAKQQMELYDQIQITPDDGKQRELMKQLLDIAADQFWIMGVSLPANGYGIVKNNFKNVPKQMFSSGQEFCNPGATMPEQYFITK